MPPLQSSEQIRHSLDHGPLHELRDVHRAADQADSRELGLLWGCCLPSFKILSDQLFPLLLLSNALNLSKAACCLKLRNERLGSQITECCHILLEDSFSCSLAMNTIDIALTCAPEHSTTS